MDYYSSGVTFLAALCKYFSLIRAYPSIRLSKAYNMEMTTCISVPEVRDAVRSQTNIVAVGGHNRCDWAESLAANSPQTATGPQ